MRCFDFLVRINQLEEQSQVNYTCMYKTDINVIFFYSFIVFFKLKKKLKDPSGRNELLHCSPISISIFNYIVHISVPSSFFKSLKFFFFNLILLYYFSILLYLDFFLLSILAHTKYQRMFWQYIKN